MTCKIEEKKRAEEEKKRAEEERKYGAMADALIFSVTMSGLCEQYVRFNHRMKMRVSTPPLVKTPETDEASRQELQNIVRAEDLPDLEAMLRQLDAARESLSRTISSLRKRW